MKLVRIDDLAPGRDTIELHPQLTVLRGVTPEIRRRLHWLFRSFAGQVDPGCSGLIEVSGVHLGLDRPTLDDLRLDPYVDAILTWPPTADPNAASSDAPTSPTGSVEPAERSTPTSPGQPPPTPGGTPLQTLWQAPVPAAVHTPVASSVVVEALARELENDRGRLRRVTVQRTELGGRMDEVRAGLDSVASAALEVCVGQIDALESRRSSLRARWEQDRAARVRDREDLSAAARRRTDEVDAIVSVDLAGVHAARSRLRDLLRAPVEADPVAVELALQIDTSMRRLRDLRGRTASADLRRHEAEQRLADAAVDAASAEQSMRTRVFDRSDVSRLEQVRDEIFAFDGRHGRLGAQRNKRKVQELRDEEAVLLERLGFDTYSSYVMGIPSVQAELERSSRLDSAVTRMEQIEREIQSLVADAPDPRELTNAEADLQRLLVGAGELLGRASIGTVRTADVADVVHDVVTRLRERRLSTSAEWDEETILAAVQLRRSVTELGGGRFADPSATAPPVIAGSRIHGGAWNGSPQELLGGVDTWISVMADTSAWVTTERAAIAEVHQQVEELDRDDLHRDDVSEWAVVEADLDAALDRMGAAEERVRLHEQAMSQLAELREIELELRSQERELLAAISRGEQERRATPANEPSDVPGGAGPGDGVGGGTAAATTPSTAPEPPAFRLPISASSTESGSNDGPGAPLRRTASGGGATRQAEDAEWTLIDRVAQQRVVSFVGSVPILLDGLPSDRASRAAVLERVLRMGEVVQVVVVTDDQQVLDWASELGTAAAVVPV